MRHHNSFLAAKTKQVFSDLNQLEQQLADQPDALLPRAAPAVGAEDESRPTSLEEYQAAVRSERRRLIDAGRRGLTKIRLAGDEPPDLTPEESVGLEAIVLLEGRPALLIQNGRFETPPQEWQILEDHRETIQPLFRGIGRIEVAGHPRLEWVGTGFLVAPSVLMTNRHVADEFSRRDFGDRWRFIPGITAQIDFAEEFQIPAAAEFSCVDVIGIHDGIDLALLRVEPSGDGSPLPDPLPVAGEPPPHMRGWKVSIVGYPAWDGRRNDPEHMSRIFSDIYNVKRLQPGIIRSFVVVGTSFSHDCSTLGGNSGSCVIDLQRGQVIGLHFAGRYRRSNKAVALWKLRESQLLRRAGVEFV